MTDNTDLTHEPSDLERLLTSLTVAHVYAGNHLLCLECSQHTRMICPWRVTEEDMNRIATDLGRMTCDRCQKSIGHEQQAPTRGRHPDEDDGQTYGDPRDEMDERRDQ